MVYYFNINPSSTIKAYHMFAKNMAQFSSELLIASLGGKDTNTMMTKMRHGDIEYMNCIQKARGSKHFIDIDFDIDKEKDCYLLDKFINDMTSQNIYFFIIETRGGYHVVLKLSTIPKKFNLYELTHILDCGAKRSNDKNEIVINSNAMIPLPGTYQGGFKVRYFNREGFMRRNHEEMYV